MTLTELKAVEEAIREAFHGGIEFAMARPERSGKWADERKAVILQRVVECNLVERLDNGPRGRI